MTHTKSWLLPDGIEEVLPPRAWQVEQLRRNLLDLCRSWGYELIIPPFVEFLDSLLTGVGSDLDIETFKVTDQLSGRLMGLRADMTPQAARIDAHSLKQEGISRLCYAGSVLHTRPHNMLASRSPLQLGAELYGCADQAADLEVIGLMLATLGTVGVTGISLDLGHIGIYKGIVAAAGLSAEQEQEYFELVQRKAITDIKDFVKDLSLSAELAEMMRVLCQLYGDESLLDQARSTLSQAPASVLKALDELIALAQSVKKAYPGIQLHFDLGELRGYRYHTGVLFAAYARGARRVVAQGGRYDNIGAAFGRARPATGFSTDLKVLVELSSDASVESRVVYAPLTDDPALAEKISQLRADGWQVLLELPGEMRQQRVRCLQNKGQGWEIA